MDDYMMVPTANLSEWIDTGRTEFTMRWGGPTEILEQMKRHGQRYRDLGCTCYFCVACREVRDNHLLPDRASQR